MRLSKIPTLAAAVLVVVGGLAACGDDEPTPVVGGDGEEVAGPNVALAEPLDGDVIAGGVELTMTAVGVAIEPAGEVHEGAGHFHVIADAGCTPPGAPIERDADHVHFGMAQTEGKIYLEPGEHDLCLQVGNGEHSALDLTDEVTITIGISSPEEWCAVVGEYDTVRTAADGSTDDFPIRKIGYENARRLLAQLQDALAQVDAENRDLVATTLSQASAMVSAWAEATDQADADARLSEVTASTPSESGPGAPWILEHCQVDLAT
jgi:hypothetical protein